jgi:hypothetical protein
MASAIKPDALIEVAAVPNLRDIGSSATGDGRRVRAEVLCDERACRVARQRHVGSFANAAAEEWVAG